MLVIVPTAGMSFASNPIASTFGHCCQILHNLHVSPEFHAQNSVQKLCIHNFSQALLNYPSSRELSSASPNFLVCHLPSSLPSTSHTSFTSLNGRLGRRSLATWMMLANMCADDAQQPYLSIQKRHYEPALANTDGFLVEWSIPGLRPPHREISCISVEIL